MSYAWAAQDQLDYNTRRHVLLGHRVGNIDPLVCSVHVLVISFLVLVFSFLLVFSLVLVGN